VRLGQTLTHTPCHGALASPQRLVGDLDKNDTDATLWVLRNEPLLTPEEPDEAERLPVVTPPRNWLAPPEEAIA